MPSAEVIYLVCDRLGFEFEYLGCKVTALTIDRNKKGPLMTDSGGQLSFDFERQYELTDKRGSVSVIVKRPPGIVEVSISLKATSWRVAG